MSDECSKELYGGPFGVITCRAKAKLCPRCGHCFDLGMENPHCVCSEEDRAMIMWDLIEL